MARNLVFSLRNADYAASPIKVERGRLYGWSEVVAQDDEGHPCRMVTMDDTGTLIIAAGGLGMGILDGEREWVDRASLKTVTLDGQEAPLIRSSYDGTIVLERVASAEEVLDCSITTVYQLDNPELMREIGAQIYAFTYSYRDSHEGSPAFVLANEGGLFLLVGYRADFEMLSLTEASAITEEDEEEDEDGDIDFSMGL
ncbi:MAG: hypothetical protein LBB76_01195 [Azoarcus sp.]|nr:hypothetical protein [Azoarcus sp.]